MILFINVILNKILLNFKVELFTYTLHVNIKNYKKYFIILSSLILPIIKQKVVPL